MAARLHILRYVAALAILLQLSLPFAQAHAAANGTDLSALICNPSGQTPSASAKAQMTNLLAALGDSEKDIEVSDCERCITPNSAISATADTRSEAVHYVRVNQQPKDTQCCIQAPRGPPCGLRAPPSFI